MRRSSGGRNECEWTRHDTTRTGAASSRPIPGGCREGRAAGRTRVGAWNADATQGKVGGQLRWDFCEGVLCKPEVVPLPVKVAEWHKLGGGGVGGDIAVQGCQGNMVHAWGRPLLQPKAVRQFVLNSNKQEQQEQTAEPATPSSNTQQHQEYQEQQTGPPTTSRNTSNEQLHQQHQQQHTATATNNRLTCTMSRRMVTPRDTRGVSSASSVSMASKSADPTPTMMMDSGRVDARTISSMVAL